MPTTNQQADLTSAITAMRNAENLLTAQIQCAVNTLTAIKLTHEYNNLDSYVSELLHAQNVMDDGTFTCATAALKDRTKGLQADVATMKTVIKDVEIAQKVIGYVTQALAFITRL